jgi:peroxiredoxin
MPRLQRFLLLVGAAACLSVAAALVVSAGLPQRAAFTGRIIPGAPPIAPELNAIAPDFTANTAEGDSITLSALRGQVVVLNFWATWCVPCRIEMPLLQTFHEQQQANGVRVVAVNLGETTAEVRAWADVYRLTFDLPLDPQGQIAAQYYLRGQPSTYIIDQNGMIRHIFFGAVDEARLAAAVLPLLPG